jgi:hypothetical protein
VGFALPGQEEPYSIKAKAKANVLTVTAAVFLAAVTLAAVLVWSGIGDRPPPPAPATPAPVTPMAPDPSTLEWRDVATWQSSGNDENPVFHISAATWRVMWAAPNDEVGDGSFALDVYNGDGTYFRDLYDTADHLGRSFDGPLRGSLGINGGGDFFLRVRTARNYEVTVQELR